MCHRRMAFDGQVQPQWTLSACTLPPLSFQQRCREGNRSKRRREARREGERMHKEKKLTHILIHIVAGEAACNIQYLQNRCHEVFVLKGVCEAPGREQGGRDGYPARICRGSRQNLAPWCIFGDGERWRWREEGAWWRSVTLGAVQEMTSMRANSALGKHSTRWPTVPCLHRMLAGEGAQREGEEGKRKAYIIRGRNVDRGGLVTHILAFQSLVKAQLCLLNGISCPLFFSPPFFFFLRRPLISNLKPFHLPLITQANRTSCQKLTT